MESLLEGLYRMENKELGFRVKNLSNQEQERLYKIIEEYKKDGIELDSDEFTLKMFQEIVECKGKIKFSKMTLEQFKPLVQPNSVVKEVFEELCLNVGYVVSRVIKNGLKMQILKIQEQELELLQLQAQISLENYYSTGLELERTKYQRDKIKKQIENWKLNGEEE